MQNPKIDVSQVKNFLIEFKQKLKVFGVVYHRSDDNSQTLLDLEISAYDRDEILLQLDVSDYYKGPDEDKYDPYSSPVWEFGKSVDNQEVYIKISSGKKNKPVVCKSFHFPKRKIHYPFK